MQMNRFGRLLSQANGLHSLLQYSSWKMPKYYSKDLQDDTLSRDCNQRPVKELNWEDAGLLVQLFYDILSDERTSYRSLIVDVPEDDPAVVTSHASNIQDTPLPVYLDTASMRMLHGPILYYPCGNPTCNLSAKWAFTQYDRASFYLWNSVTRLGAQAQLLIPRFGATWYKIILQAPPQNPPQLIRRKYDRRNEKFEMFINHSSQRYYLVPVTAVRDQEGNNSKEIVGALRDDLVNKEKTFIWSEERFPF